PNLPVVLLPFGIGKVKIRRRSPATVSALFPSKIQGASLWNTVSADRGLPGVCTGARMRASPSRRPMKLDRRTLLKMPALAAAVPALLETTLSAAERELEPRGLGGEL